MLDPKNLTIHNGLTGYLMRWWGQKFSLVLPSLTVRLGTWENNGAISLNKGKLRGRGVMLSLVSDLHGRLKLCNPFKLF